ncbi:hypothetical protein PO878_04265 [Iamia majanohamensis]|uniref:Uncharacterized protein n=1 Tax=Iamia majanohamensis TaxID=467976 RepID=A0AAE9YG70_9ACTN|nr:hypothetical protein [Iamia majanohamensis]WCO67937.1 hypothetical protein PO878_04265 [Iamia majanohamensis]
MTAALSVEGDPGLAAEHAADTVRTLNHLTLSRPSTGTPGWEDVADLYRVLTEVRVLTERLPHALGQLAQHLEHPGGDGYRCDAATESTPDELIALAAGSLREAQTTVERAGDHLACAQGAASHLAPRCPGDR